MQPGRPLNNIIKPAGRHVFQRARKALRLTACANTSRRAVTQAPRPGNTALTSGPTTVRIEHKPDQIIIGALTRDDAHALARSLACLGRLGVCHTVI
jgi:hypothetical protein